MDKLIKRFRLIYPFIFLVLILAGVTSLLGCAAMPEPAAAQQQVIPGGDAQRGREAIRDYGCDSCHTIPGIRTANATVGPPLTGWAARHYISGKLANTPDNLIRWIQFPQAIEPGTAMPNMGVTEQDARDIAAYLYTLR
jgi:cytochrome c